MNLIQRTFFNKRRQYAREQINSSPQLDVGSNIYPITEHSITLDIRREKRPRICADVLYLPLRDGCISNITLLEILEHLDVKAQEKAISECKRVSINAARIIISMPNYSVWMKPIQDIVWFIREYTIEREYHNSEFTDTHVGKIRPEELISIIKTQNLGITKIKRILLYDITIVAEK